MDIKVFEQTAEQMIVGAETVWSVLKWVYVLAFGIYSLFALVIVAQVKQMVMALSGGFDKGLWLVALGHLGLAIFCLIMALVIL